MGGVDLPVAVPQRPPARTGHHRGQLDGEPGVDRPTAVRGGLLGDSAAYGIAHPPPHQSPRRRGHPRREPFSRPTQVGYTGARSSSLRMRSRHGVHHRPKGRAALRRTPPATAPPGVRHSWHTARNSGHRLRAEETQGCPGWSLCSPIDGMQYVYRVYAPDDALPADLFWAAFHCHDEGPHPRASDRFDAAEIWRNPAASTIPDGSSVLNVPGRRGYVPRHRNRTRPKGWSHGRSQRGGTHRGTRREGLGPADGLLAYGEWNATHTSFPKGGPAALEVGGTFEENMKLMGFPAEVDGPSTSWRPAGCWPSAARARWG